MADVEAAARLILTGGGTAAFLFAVVRLALKFQADFADKYAARNAELEARVDALEAELEVMRKVSRRCELRELVLMRWLAKHGVELPPDYPTP